MATNDFAIDFKKLAMTATWDMRINRMVNAQISNPSVIIIKVVHHSRPPLHVFFVIALFSCIYFGALVSASLFAHIPYLIIIRCVCVFLHVGVCMWMTTITLIGTHLKKPQSNITLTCNVHSFLAEEATPCK